MKLSATKITAKASISLAVACITGYQILFGNPANINAVTQPFLLGSSTKSPAPSSTGKDLAISFGTFLPAAIKNGRISFPLSSVPCATTNPFARSMSISQSFSVYMLSLSVYSHTQ